MKKITIIILLFSSCCINKSTQYHKGKIEFKDIIEIESSVLKNQCRNYGYAYLLDRFNQIKNHVELNEIFKINNDTLFIVHIISENENKIFLNKKNLKICVVEKEKSVEVTNFTKKINSNLELCFSKKSDDDCYCPYSGNKIVIVSKIFRKNENIKYLSSYFCEEILKEIF